MKKQKGFSLIELLIVVAIILVIAAIAIPNLLRARISANEASAVHSIRSITTAEISYAASYPTQGYTDLPSLGGAQPCTPAPSGACFLDNPLSSGTKEGYTFTATPGTPTNGVNMSFTSLASPFNLYRTGTQSFCSDQTGVIYYNSGSSTCASGNSVLQ